jgi:hypothetical protein
MLTKDSLLWLKMCSDFGSDDDRKHSTIILNYIKEIEDEKKLDNEIILTLKKLSETKSSIIEQYQSYTENKLWKV